MRISATTLESFRLYMQPDQDWMTEAELVASIKGEFVPTPRVILGKAFGQVLENPDTYRVSGGYRCDGYTFEDAVMREPLDLIDRRGVFEAKAVKRYGAHEVVSKADHLYGARLREFKTTTGPFNYEKYEASCQWRFMTDAFEPSVITYHVFLLDDHENGVVELKGVETFNLYPYAECHQQCRALVGDFVEYVTAKGLAGLLEQRQREAA